MISTSDLLTANVALNGTSAIFLTGGYLFIRQRNIYATYPFYE